jgi:hypothetical protein
MRHRNVSPNGNMVSCDGSTSDPGVEMSVAPQRDADVSRAPTTERSERAEQGRAITGQEKLL